MNSDIELFALRAVELLKDRFPADFRDDIHWDKGKYNVRRSKPYILVSVERGEQIDESRPECGFFYDVEIQGNNLKSEYASIMHQFATDSRFLQSNFGTYPNGNVYVMKDGIQYRDATESEFTAKTVRCIERFTLLGGYAQKL